MAASRLPRSISTPAWRRCLSRLSRFTLSFSGGRRERPPGQHRLSGLVWLAVLPGLAFCLGQLCVFHQMADDILRSECQFFSFRPSSGRQDRFTRAARNTHLLRFSRPPNKCSAGGCSFCSPVLLLVSCGIFIRAQSRCCRSLHSFI